MQVSRYQFIAPKHSFSPLRITLVGLIALTIAMGVGRFAFTPILPMMQSDEGLTLAAASWLATANYLGYLIGALSASVLPESTAIRWSLAGIALVTFGMGIVGYSFIIWLVLRLLAGIASAWILVHVSAWTLRNLEAAGRHSLSGFVFTGVGIGIAVTGLFCMGLIHLGTSSNRAWELFGIVSFLLAAAIWPAFAKNAQHPAPHAMRQKSQNLVWNKDAALLIACYCAFGFGYIIPATFLPAMAKHLLANSTAFGWVWPVFGTTAAISTALVTRRRNLANNRSIWSIGYFLMAAGVVLPAFWPSLVAILFAALLVGGTFMVITTVAMMEAHRVSRENATGLIGAMTTAFAAGQIAGPLAISGVANIKHGFFAVLLIASSALIISGFVLLKSSSTSSSR